MSPVQSPPASNMSTSRPPSLPPGLASATRGQAGQDGDRRQATLAEVFPETVVDGAAPGFVIAHLPDAAGPVLWIQDRLSLRESGRPYLAGMARPPEMYFLTVNRAVDVLWAMEQGLGCTSLSAVVGEVWGDPPALDFTASKRLALRSEAHAVPAWLIRRAARADLSAARERWRLASLPSLPEPDDMRAPGAPQWQAELFRARWRTPGSWVARYDHGDHALTFDHAVAATDDPNRQSRAARALG